MLNMNEETGIRYGIIAANSLHPEVVDSLLYGIQSKDLSYEAAEYDFRMEIESEVNFAIQEGLLDESDFEEECDNLYEERLQQFNDDYMCEEPVVEGQYQGVKYRTTWLGGALLIWIFESPITGKFSLCSPCVPNCCDLDHPWVNGYEGYDVPADWRDTE